MFPLPKRYVLLVSPNCEEYKIFVHLLDLSDRPFRNSRASRSLGWRILWSSETSCGGLRSSKVVKGSVGSVFLGARISHCCSFCCSSSVQASSLADKACLRVFLSQQPPLFVENNQQRFPEGGINSFYTWQSKESINGQASLRVKSKKAKHVGFPIFSSTLTQTTIDQWRLWFILLNIHSFKLPLLCLTEHFTILEL